jgi:hypothetical protein
LRIGSGEQATYQPWLVFHLRISLATESDRQALVNLPDSALAIYWLRLRTIYYANTREEAAAIGFDDEFIYREIPLAPADRRIPGVHLRTPTSAVPFAEWAAKPDKISY